jgi:hypothetical protein
VLHGREGYFQLAGYGLGVRDSHGGGCAPAWRPRRGARVIGAVGGGYAAGGGRGAGTQLASRWTAFRHPLQS